VDIRSIVRKMSRIYLLCTVAKNEEVFLPKLASDILQQSQRPSLWVLLDDRSCDGTAEIMKSLNLENPWIRYYKYNARRGKDLGMHLAMLKSYATHLTIEIAVKEKIEYEFIGILDSDIHIDSRFFEKMIDKMIGNCNIGLISAEIQEFAKDGSLYLKHSRLDLPGGATMLCRRRCFEDVGGVDPNAYPFDAIIVARAKLRNWETKRLKDVTAIQRRKTSSANGMKKGYEYESEKVFFLRYNFLYILARAAYISICSRVDYGFFFFWGYMKKLIKGGKKLLDKELIKYFRRDRFYEIIRYRFRRMCTHILKINRGK